MGGAGGRGDQFQEFGFEACLFFGVFGGAKAAADGFQRVFNGLVERRLTENELDELAGGGAGLFRRICEHQRVIPSIYLL